MKNAWLLSLFLLAFFFMDTTLTQAATAPQISYVLTFADAQAHYVDVQMDITGINQSIIDLKMPVWTPGSYLVREFARNVETINAYTGHEPLPLKKIRKNIWRLETKGSPALTIKYRVYAFESSVRTSFVDASHAFLSSPDIFIYPDGMLDKPSIINIAPTRNWKKVSASLENVNGDPFTLVSPNYDILFDSPIEVGNQDVFGFGVGDVKYEVAMQGGGNYNKERLTKDLTKIIEEEAAIFGENPNKHYTFIVHNYLNGGGGLEHLSSTVLGASRLSYGTENGYQNFLQLAAHEHFHLWNVKRLRPMALGPFDYDNENYTTELWIAEGFTAYYQNIIVRRTHLYPPDNYLNLLTADINALENQPGAKIQPLADASFDAWIKAYRPNENSNNATISYYTKGAMIALLLDLEVIHSTKGAKSLDDVMAHMYNEYYKTKNRGYTDEEFKQGIEQIAGKNMDEFYKKYIYGLVPLPYNNYLRYAGYQITDELAGNNDPALGISVTNVNGKIIITNVVRESAAWMDGLNVNDEIDAINGNNVTTLDGILNDKQPGDKLVFNINRDGLPMIIPVKLLKSTRVKYKIEEMPEINGQQLIVRKKWLKL